MGGSALSLRLTLRCPFCSGRLDYPQGGKPRPIPCGQCGRYLKLAGWCENLIDAIAVTIAAAALFAWGVRGWSVVVGIAILWLPLRIGVGLLLGRVLGPRLEECERPPG